MPCLIEVLISAQIGAANTSASVTSNLLLSTSSQEDLLTFRCLNALNTEYSDTMKQSGTSQSLARRLSSSAKSRGKTSAVTDTKKLFSTSGSSSELMCCPLHVKLTKQSLVEHESKAPARVLMCRHQLREFSDLRQCT